MRLGFVVFVLLALCAVIGLTGTFVCARASAGRWRALPFAVATVVAIATFSMAVDFDTAEETVFAGLLVSLAAVALALRTAIRRR